MNIYINVEELQRQRSEAIARRARLDGGRPLARVQAEPRRSGVGRREKAAEQAKADAIVLPGLTIRLIVNTTSDHYGISVVDMMSTRRHASYVKPRHVAMYLAKTLTIRSFPQIGAAMGRDHTTVMAGVQKIARLIEEDHGLAAEVEALRLKLTGGDNADT